MPPKLCSRIVPSLRRWPRSALCTAGATTLVFAWLACDKPSEAPTAAPASGQAAAGDAAAPAPAPDHPRDAAPARAIDGGPDKTSDNRPIDAATADAATQAAKAPDAQPGNSPDAGPKKAAPPSLDASAPAAVATCEQMAANIASLMLREQAAAGQQADALKQQMSMIEKQIAKECNKGKWSAKYRSCAQRASSQAELQKCQRSGRK